MALPVSAVLLAAGSSKRMGRPKQLLPLGAKPAVRRCLDCIMASGIDDIVVVVGREADDIKKELHSLPVKIAHNRDPESEMADSVRTGVRSLGDSRSGVLVCLSDHPLVSPETLKALIHLHRKEPHKIIIPCYHGRRGHPTLFPRPVIEEIFSGITLKDIIKKDPQRNRDVDVQDEGVVLDMDTEEDYRNILKKLGET